jgi:molybdopterin-guanine dinucleotide biosynthesis protein A
MQFALFISLFIYLLWLGLLMKAPTLLINAGGSSRRMGQPKALLPVPGSGEPLICHIATRLLPLADEVLVIANDPTVVAAVRSLDARSLPDKFPNTGPLGGLATGLAHVKGWCICVACDLPFVHPDVFRYLLAQVSDEWDAIVPLIGDRPEPLHALYHRRCLTAVEAALRSGQRRMDSFLDDVRIRFVTEEELQPIDPVLRSFVNVNTPEEWEEASRPDL